MNSVNFIVTGHSVWKTYSNKTHRIALICPVRFQMLPKGCLFLIFWTWFLYFRSSFTNRFFLCVLFKFLLLARVWSSNCWKYTEWINICFNHWLQTLQWVTNSCINHKWDSGITKSSWDLLVLNILQCNVFSIVGEFRGGRWGCLLLSLLILSYNIEISMT